MKTNYGKILRNGILDENPIFRLVLGMCSTLAITTSVSAWAWRPPSCW